MSLALVLTAALAAASAGEEPRTENVIEGLEPMRWGKGRDNTWANAYALSLQGAGEDVTYDTVMGYSGAAFRLHFHQPDWCPSSPDATVGYNHAKPAARAFGYAATGGLVDTKDADAVAETRAKIVASIDAGKPVRGIDLVQIPDWGVIVGYRDGGDTLLCRDYHAEGDEYAEVAKFPWIVEFMGDKGRQPSARENVVRALQIAIELADTPRFGGYASGFAAYDSWIADLGDEARYTDADADLMTHMTHVNAWCYDSLTDARASATRFLRASAALVPDAAADLQKIAAEYDAVLDVLREGRGDIVYPSSLKDGATWTPEMRAAAASHLHDAREHETKAVDTIRQALTAEWADLPIDYLSLKLEGNGHKQDSFSLVMAEAARLLGREADYETICAVSGNAFSPRIDLGEDCTAWWHVEGRDVGMELACRRLGLTARKMEAPAFDVDWDNEDDVKRLHTELASQFRAAMQGREVVLSYNGWGGPPGGFAPWGWFGIVTEATEDGVIRGACLNGRDDNVLKWVGVNWAISRADVRDSASESDLAALRNAVAQIRGLGDDYASTDRVVYGVAALDAWTKKMGEAPFCEPCYESAPDKVWTCAINNGEAHMAQSQVAASYLRSLADAYGPELTKAAARYDRIAELLAPAVTGENGTHYSDFIGDAEGQAQLAAVADGIDAALAGIVPGT